MGATTELARILLDADTVVSLEQIFQIGLLHIVQLTKTTVIPNVYLLYPCKYSSIITTCQQALSRNASSMILDGLEYT